MVRSGGGAAASAASAFRGRGLMVSLPLRSAPRGPGKEEYRSPTLSPSCPSRLSSKASHGGVDRSLGWSPSLQEPLLHSTTQMSLEEVVNMELYSLQKVLKHQMHDVVSHHLQKFNQVLINAVQNFEDSSSTSHSAALSMPVPVSANSGGYSPLHRTVMRPGSHACSSKDYNSVTAEDLPEDEPVLDASVNLSVSGGVNDTSELDGKAFNEVVESSSATIQSSRTLRRSGTGGPFIPEREDSSEDLEGSCLEDLYHTSGFAQHIARHPFFTNVTLVVILANTVWMAVDTDHNHATVLCQAAPIFQIMDNFFCAYFSFEIGIRLFACKHKWDAFLDYSFCFDALLVAMMIWECWIQVIIFLLMERGGHSQMKAASIFRLFRVFRLMRVARTARLLQMMPELFILVKSIGAGIRCMMVTLLMLVIVIYVFAIMFTTLLQGTSAGAGCFDNVPQAMNFMLLQVLTGFDKDLFSKLLEKGFVYYSLWLCFVLIGSMSIMNVLIGILCEVVAGTADHEKARATRKDMEDRIRHSCQDRTGILSRAEMLRILSSHSVADRLSELQVDQLALEDAVHCLHENQELSVGAFAELLVQFRGCKPATVRDLIDLRKFLTNELSYLEIEISRSGLGGHETKRSISF
eukprot:TRINITY_DN16873_c0_g1_i2.p1 TRINITY_DN16873_c0_g1~~TRINITY_DN16873_c0_g1_i2.p1  ORF type:complete len:635 (-),score=68.72 TRINITY_DN16873_c0_g1_i2:97-2001(-)